MPFRIRVKAKNESAAQTVVTGLVAIFPSRLVTVSGKNVSAGPIDESLGRIMRGLTDILMHGETTKIEIVQL